MQSHSFQFGYTFLELVVAVGILGVLAVAATSLFFSAIRGSGKVDVTTEVKQNGQFALITFEQLTRNSSAVAVCSPTPTSSVTLRAQGGETLVFSCEDMGGAGYIASSSASTTVRLTSDRVRVTQCAFYCEGFSGTGETPLITAEFTLQQAQGGADVTAAATVDFSTSVSLRNFR